MRIGSLGKREAATIFASLLAVGGLCAFAGVAGRIGRVAGRVGTDDILTIRRNGQCAGVQSN